VVASLLVLNRLERTPRHRESRAPGTGRSAHGSRNAGRSSPHGTQDARAPEESGGPDAGDGVARVAIVIDDVGFEERPILELAGIGLPLTFAILPYQRYSRSLSARLRAAGHEVILHLPMEPRAFPRRDPGEGAVDEGMAPGEIETVVLRDIEEVPGVVGVNNHMGSRATADPLVMRAVLGVVRRQGLYFLDSRTTSDTVAYDTARALGVPAVERSVFLDDRREASYIEGQVRELLRKARERGSALAIGHPDPVTVEVLKRSADLLRGAEVRMVPASELAGVGDGGPS
jgi:uncharacterized protein